MLSSLKQEFDSLFFSAPDSFCEQNKSNGARLQEQCSALTYDNCSSTSCCVWVGKSARIGKCAAGDATGITFKTDPNGNPVNVDTYYYQNKCYGTQCPLAKMVRMTRMKKAMTKMKLEQEQEQEQE
jgi:hypothetical protein